MSANLFLRLARMLPDAAVYVGRVLEHHDDDTSTVELPTNQALTVVGGNVARGSLIRPRGRTVPVGGWAFVRRGVIETRAPDPAPEAISVGAPVAPALTDFLDTFAGTGTLEARITDSGHSWGDSGGAPIVDAYVSAGLLETTVSTALRLDPQWAPATTSWAVEADIVLGAYALPQARFEMWMQDADGYGPMLRVQPDNTGSIYIDYQSNDFDFTSADDSVISLAPHTLRMEVLTNSQVRVLVDGVQLFLSAAGLNFPNPLDDPYIVIVNNASDPTRVRLDRVLAADLP